MSKHWRKKIIQCSVIVLRISTSKLTIKLVSFQVKAPYQATWKVKFFSFIFLLSNLMIFIYYQITFYFFLLLRLLHHCDHPFSNAKTMKIHGSCIISRFLQTSTIILFFCYGFSTSTSQCNLLDQSSLLSWLMAISSPFPLNWNISVNCCSWEGVTCMNKAALQPYGYPQEG